MPTPSSTLCYAATTVDVTPPTPVPLGGYAARDVRPAVGTHDRLTASLVRLSGAAGDGVCWVAVDALSVDATTAARIRAVVGERAGVAPDSVLVCASHTHSGPATWVRPPVPMPGDPADDRALDRLVQDIGRGAARLPVNRTAVTAGWSTVADAGVGGNRYDPAGPHDPSIGALTLRDENDAVVSVVFDYACHPTVLGHDNLAFSGDYPAATRRVVRAALGAAEGMETPPVVAFLQGAAGDASTRFTRRANDFAEADRQGGMVAGALLRAVLDATPRPFGAAVPTVFRAVCRVPTRSLPGAARVRDTVTTARAAWERFRDDGEPASPPARIARTRYEGALILAALCEVGLPAEVALPISVVAFGGVAWAHLPVEPFTSVGGAIRAASPFASTRTIGYTDGYFGYLADPAAYADDRYEALSSVFGPEAGARVVADAVALLRKARAAV